MVVSITKLERLADRPKLGKTFTLFDPLENWGRDGQNVWVRNKGLYQHSMRSFATPQRALKATGASNRDQITHFLTRVKFRVFRRRVRIYEFSLGPNLLYTFDTASHGRLEIRVVHCQKRKKDIKACRHTYSWKRWAKYFNMMWNLSLKIMARTTVWLWDTLTSSNNYGSGYFGSSVSLNTCLFSVIMS